MKVGLLGCGNIGFAIGEALVNNLCPGKELSVICDLEKTDKIISLLEKSNAKYVKKPEELLNEEVDIIIEATNPKVAAKYALDIIRSKTDLFLLSSGALLEQNLLTELQKATMETKARIIVPSGAVGGLSVIKSAKVKDGLEEVTITTTKHPRSLMNAPFLSTSTIDLAALNKAVVVFEGPAREAIQGFPQNVNVAVTLSLAGLGPEKTIVKIVADPNVSITTHEIFVKGSFGTMELKLKNEVSPDNPKSSYLASLSAISALKDYDNHIFIGY